jgi:hypothetical protein
MKLETGRLLKHIADTASDTIHEDVDECMSEFVDDDWADEFDDIYEAYEETGRGCAENQAITAAIRVGCLELGLNTEMDTDEFCYLYDALAAEWNLET